MVKVLVCVDKSENAEKAFRWYVERFNKPNCQVIVLHIPEYWGDLQRMMSPSLLQDCVHETNVKTKKLEDKFTNIGKDYGIDVSFEVDKGNVVWHAICVHAKTVGADVIVLGTRGLGSLKRTLLGSVSEGVLHHCHVPVLIYKE